MKQAARRSATKAVKARLKAKGINISYIPVRDIAAMARDHLAQNRAFFIVEAKQAIATYPEFAWLRTKAEAINGTDSHSTTAAARVNWS
jgi:hypothetical protein